MYSHAKGAVITLATAFVVAVVSAYSQLYIDVQLMKKDQERLSELALQTKQLEELTSKLDKNFAVQSETLKVLTTAIERLQR